MKKDMLKKAGWYFTIGGAVFLFVLLSYSLKLFTGPELFWEDRLVSAKPVSSDIIIVAIDDASIAKIGQWPWPRSVFADAFSRLEQYKPRAVALDVVFSEASRIGVDDDRKLALTLSRIPYPVIMPVEGRDISVSSDEKASTAGVLQTLNSLMANAPNVSIGHVNLLIDRDGVVRKFPFNIEDEFAGISFLSFAGQAVVKAGIPFDESSYGNIPRIVYSGPPGAIRRISFSRILEKDDLSALLSDKLILIGATAPDLHDEKPTPFGEGTEMPGVEIQANIANMLILSDHLDPLRAIPSYLLFLLLAILPAFFFAFSRTVFKPLILSIGTGLLTNVVFLALFENGITVNFIHVNLSWILSAGALFAYRYLLVERSRREMRTMFSKYVSSAVLETILANPEKVTLGGEEKTITVLFSDIRGFTTLSEKTTPKELVSILNRYFTLMTGEVLAHGGVLDKYIGDAVMAFWGAPLPDSNQADNAFLAAKGMLEKLKTFNVELKKEKDITIDIGIGIYTGSAVIGNIGSFQRFDYTAMGDTVNVASRLEGLNKEYRTHLIVGETTKAQINLPAQFKKLGETQVKGRVEPITIYTIEE